MDDHVKKRSFGHAVIVRPSKKDRGSAHAIEETLLGLGLSLEEAPFDFDVTILVGADAGRTQVIEALSPPTSSGGLRLACLVGSTYAARGSTYLELSDTNEPMSGLDLSQLRRWVEAEETQTLIVIVPEQDSNSALGTSATPQGLINALSPLGLHQSTIVCPVFSDNQGSADSDSSVVLIHELTTGLIGGAADQNGNVTASSLYRFLCDIASKHGLPSPILNGDSLEPPVIVSGLFPRLSQLQGENLFRSLESDAELMVRGRVRWESADNWMWGNGGLVRASETFEPVVMWFENTIDNVSRILDRPKFRSQYLNALNYLQHVSQALDRDIQTPVGTIERALGRGGFGTVWKISTDISDQTFAYKVCNPFDEDMVEKVRRFRRGYDAMKNLAHPNIVSVHEFTECPLGFTMDYIDGGNLEEYKGILVEPEDILIFLIRISETILYAHSMDSPIYHRDIKPGNILVEFNQELGEWIPYITDFDLAWFRTESKTITRFGFGTEGYAPPEQLQNLNRDEVRVPTIDIYSFGQLLYFLVVNDHPNPIDFDRNRDTLRERLNSWSAGMTADRYFNLYLSLTNYRATERPQSFVAVVDQLGTILAELRGYESGGAISRLQFVREIAHGLGLPDLTESSQLWFQSRTGRTHCDIMVLTAYKRDTISFNAHFTAVQLHEAGATHFSTARAQINYRVDEAIRGFPNTRRKAGSQGTYEVHVSALQVPQTAQGVELCVSVVEAVIAAIEG